MWVQIIPVIHAYDDTATMHVHDVQHQAISNNNITQESYSTVCLGNWFMYSNANNSWHQPY